MDKATVQGQILDSPIEDINLSETSGSRINGPGELFLREKFRRTIGEMKDQGAGTLSNDVDIPAILIGID